MLFAVSMFVLTACDGCGEKITEKPQEQVETYINLSLAEKQMIVGDEETLVAYTPIIDGLSISWSSSDENIVTVKDGVVTAVRPGTADVVATFDDKTDSCKITVGLGSQVPVIEFENQIVNDTIFVSKNGEVNLGASVKFNNKFFNDATFTYTVVSGEGFGSMDTTTLNKFVAGATNGSAVVEVKASWRGIESPEFTRLITINIVSNNVILIDQGKTNSIELYTSAEHGGRSWSIEDVLEGRILATEDDVDRSSTLTITVTNQKAGNGSDAQVVTYDEATKKITALTYGTADLVLSFTTSENKTFTTVYPINVNRPLATYETVVEYFSALDGEFDLGAIFGKDVVLLDAYQGGDYATGSPLKVVDNKVLGLYLESTDAMEEHVVTIYDDTVGYEINVEAYTKVIDSYSDFASFHGVNDVEGYVVLKNDIELDESIDNLESSSASFVGTFEGNGHYVRVRTIKGGLFNGLRKATIQNVAFIVEQKSEKTERYIIAKSGSGNVVFKDVLFQINTNYSSATNFSIVGVNNMANTDYRNVIVDVANGNFHYVDTAHKYGGLFEDYTSSAWFTKLDTDFNGDDEFDKRFNYDSFENTYYINSDYKIVGFYRSETALTAMYFAQNDGDFYNEAKELYEAGTFGFYNGLFRYDNYGSMNQAGNDYSSFNPEVWDFANGVPQFKSLDYSNEIQMPTAIELTAGVKDTEQLSAFIFGLPDKPTYSCEENNGVITVDENGLVTAIGVGQATITATIGEKTATCVVTVKWANNTAPVLSVVDVVVEPVVINLGSVKEYTAKLMYNGVEVDGSKYAWTTSVGDATFTNADQKVCTFNAPATYKTGHIKVVVTYYNQDFAFDFDVEIARDPEMQINGAAPADVVLFTDATWGATADAPNKVEEAFDVTSLAGFEIVSITSDNTDVVAYDATNKKLTSVGVGETYVTIIFNFGEGTVTKKVKVTVNASVKDITDKTLDYSEYDFTINGIEELFEEGTREVVIDRVTQINEETQEATELTVEAGNLVKGIVGDDDVNTYDTVKLIVYSGKKAVKLSVNAYKMLIDTADDLAVFAGATSGTVINGYYKVINDITLEGSSWEGNNTGKSGAGTTIFKGIFDGNGHVVELALQTYGLFGRTESATIKNTAFIVKKIGKVNFAYATILAYQMTSSTVENCYFTYDLPEGTKIDVGYYGWGQSSGLGIYATAGNKTSFNNVIIDTSSVETESKTYAQPYAYGSIMTKATNTDKSGTWETVTSDVYVITTNKHLSYRAKVTQEQVPDPTPENPDKTKGNGKIASFDGIAAVWFAENDTDAYNAQKDLDGVTELSDTVKKQLAGTKRYDNYEAMKTAGNDYSAFSTDVWDTTAGYPVFKALPAYELVNNINKNAEYFIGGAKNTLQVSIENTNTTGVSLYANYATQTYKPTLTLLKGEGVVTVDDASDKILPVANVIGTATVKAVYVIENVTIEKIYTVTVTLEMLKGNVNYSTVDGAIFFPEDDKLTDKTVTSITDNADQTIVYYENGAVTDQLPKNNDSKDLTDYTKAVVITLDDGSRFSSTLVSYTKVLTTADDMKMFSVDSVGEKNTVKGYFIVNNDLLLEGSTWTGNTGVNGKQHSFSGVFDGNGHVVEVALGGKYGIFCTTNKATIKNTAFVVKQIGAKDFAYASILAYSMAESVVQDCYFTYDLPAGTKLDASYYGWGQSSGIGIYASAGNNTKFNNVVIDNLTLELENLDKAFAYGNITAKAKEDSSGTGGGSWRPRTSNVYVISTNKYMGYLADITPEMVPAPTPDNPDKMAATNKIASINGIKCAFFASNDTEAYEACEVVASGSKNLLEGSYRYDSITAFAGAQGNDYSEFSSDVWDLTAGYPVFKALPAYELINNINKNAEYYIGGNKNTVQASIENTNSAGYSLYASYGSNTYKPTLTLLTGEGIVTVDDASDKILPVANAIGTATVKAVYVIEGITIEKTYTINVTLEMLNGQIMYSTIDNDGAGKIYFPEDSRLDGKTIKSITDLGDQTIVYYENGAVTGQLPKNVDSKDLTDYYKTVVVTMEDGTVYSTTLGSYTKVLTKSADFAIFRGADESEVKGYYILANDIMLDGTWEGNTGTNGKTHKFTGTFDGNGHIAEIALKNYGIFGTLSEATVKNTAFVVKQIGGKNLAYTSILAYQIVNTTVSDCYFAYDLPTGTAIDVGYYGFGQTSGFGLYTFDGVGVKLNNVIIDNSNVELANVDNAYAYGAIKAKTSPTTAYVPKATDVYVISTDKYMSYLANVAAEGNTITAHNGIMHAWFAENDTEAFNACTVSGTKLTVTGVKRYDSMTALASAQGNEYGTFISNVWDLTKGYPVYKGVPEYQLVSDINKTAEYYIGGSKDAYQVSIENTNTTGVSLYANYATQIYKPTLTLLTGEGVVTVDDVNDVILPVANAKGTAEVKAVYDIEGITVVKTYTITVTLELLNGNIMYSTKDDKIYFPEDSRLEGNTIASITDINDSTIVYYENGADTDAMPKNNDSNDLTDYTKTVVVTMSDGTVYSTTLISYTKVITEASELLMFNVDDGDAVTGSESFKVGNDDKGKHVDTDVTIDTLIKGYYILGKDIVGTEALSFTHGDMITAYANETTGFAGTFDGNGHQVKVDIINSGDGSSRNGIFGQLQSGAVIKNVAFVDCTMNKGVFLFSGAMNNTRNAYVENVYLNIEATGRATYGGSAWGKTTYTNIKGVFIDNDTATDNISNGKTTAEILAGNASTEQNHGHGAYVSNEWTANADRLNGAIVISEAPLSYTRPSVAGHKVAVGCNSGLTDGSTVPCTCETGSTVTVEVLSNVYHYASVYELSTKTSELVEVLANFDSNWWDLSKGYPIFKGLEDKVMGDLVASAEFSLGGSVGATEATLFNTADSSITVTATLAGQNFTPTLTIVDGNLETDVVTVAGNTITAKENAIGVNTVKATYTILDVTVEKIYTIKVNPEERAGTIKYSTLDQKLYFSEELEDVENDIVKIEELTNGVYYEEGAVTENILENTDETDLTKKTQKVAVTLEDGSNFSVEFVSYTMILTKADDFKVFEKNSTLNTSEIKKGYYILGNDITLGETTWTGNTFGGDSTGSTFSGILDGNGHYAEIKVKTNGLLGTLKDAKVMNIALIVKGIGSSSAGATVLGQKFEMSEIIDSYVKYDKVTVDTSLYAWGQTSGLGLYIRGSAGAKITNTIIDTSLVEMVNNTYEKDYAYGSILTKGDASSTAYRPKTSDVYVISTNKYLSYLANVTASNNEVSAFDGIKYALFAEEDEAEYNSSTATTKYVVEGSHRFDTYLDMPNSVNTYSAFNTDVWNFDNGYPIFNACYNEIYSNIIASATTYSIGGNMDGSTEGEITLNDEALENVANRTLSIVAYFKGTAYEDATLTIASGEDLVTVENNNVIAKTTVDADGVATINAKFVIEGVTLEKTFTVKVIVPEVSAVLDGKVYYSTMDSAYVFSNAEYNSLTIQSIVDSSSNSNFANETNVAMEKDVTVTFTNGTAGSIKLYSVKKVMKNADDLKLLIDTNGASASKKDVTGIYLLANDIIVDGSYTPVANAYSYFKGVLDGNGFTIKNLTVDANGLLGNLGAGGVMKNLAITVTTASSGATGLIASGHDYSTTVTTGYNENDTTGIFTIDNCYFDIDVDWAGNNASTLFDGNPYLGLRMNNSIIDLASGVLTPLASATSTTYAGIVFNKMNQNYVTNYGETGATQNLGNGTTAFNLFKNCYYINSDYGFIVAMQGRTTTTKNAIICSGDTTTDTSLYTNRVGQALGITRYDTLPASTAGITIRPSTNA